jgi:hypothetical protein
VLADAANKKHSPDFHTGRKKDIKTPQALFKDAALKLVKSVC